MTLTASESSARAFSGLGETRTDRVYFAVFCISIVLSNVFTFLYHASASPLFNLLSNAACMVLLAYSVRILFRAQSSDSGSHFFLWLALVLTALSVLINFPNASLVDALKYLSVYILYYVGRVCGGRTRTFEMHCLYVLAALPIIFLAIFGRSKVYLPVYEPFAYLANANTAVLYFSALLFAATQIWGNGILLLQFINAAVMNKVGALVATVAAIGLWMALPLRRETVVALLAAGTGAVIAFELGAFDRAIAAFDNLALVFQLKPHTIASMSYKDLVKLTGTTDLSAFFRLMHWSNIWELYSDQGLLTLLFGYGAGQTQLLTHAGMVPHNDYLRILAEYGLLNFAVFVLFILHVWRRLTASPANVLFLVLCIYFFSENLLDSFTSMALFFAYAGRFTTAANPSLLRRAQSLGP